MTVQFAELLEYKGQETALFCEPLEDYWDLHPPRPNINMLSTACYRGYVGKWKIDDDGRLLLLGFKDDDDDRRRLTVKDAVTIDEWKEIQREDGSTDIVQSQRPITIEALLSGATLPIHATWYSGTLRCPLGELENYVHMGYGSQYQRDLLIEIKYGMFVSERERKWNQESGEPLNPDEYKVVARQNRETEEEALQWARVEWPFDLATHAIFSDGDDICGLASLDLLRFWNAHTKHDVRLQTLWFRIMSKSNYLELTRGRLERRGYASREKVEESATGFIESDIDTILDAPIRAMAYFCLDDAALQALANTVRQQRVPAIRLTLGPRPVVGKSDANGPFGQGECANLRIEKVEIDRHGEAIRSQSWKYRTTDFTILDEYKVEIERATRDWVQRANHAARIGFELAKSFSAAKINDRLIDTEKPFDLRQICEAFVGPTLNERGEEIRFVHYGATELSKRRWFENLWAHAANPVSESIPATMKAEAVAGIARWYVDTTAATSPTLEWAMVDALLHVAAAGAKGHGLELLVIAYSYVADAHFNAGAAREVLYRAIASGARIESVAFDVLDKRIRRCWSSAEH